MEVWGWIAVYAVGLTLLQLLVYRYLLNSGSSLTRRVGTPFGDSDGDTSWSNGSSGSGTSETPPASETPHTPDGSGNRPNANSPPGRQPIDAWPEAASHTEARAPDGSAGRSCTHCGAVNEADETFSHCWNCAHQL
jgi:hypothetical protein